MFILYEILFQDHTADYHTVMLWVIRGDVKVQWEGVILVCSS